MITPEGVGNQLERRLHRGLGRPKRLVVIVAFGIGMMALPWTVLAATFLDVGPSNPFYSYIEDLYHARIASGCGGGNYCPDAFVTREQMAAFIQRSAGDVSYAHSIFAKNGTGDVLTTTIKTGTTAGGKILLHIEATLDATLQPDDLVVSSETRWLVGWRQQGVGGWGNGAEMWTSLAQTDPTRGDTSFIGVAESTQAVVSVPTGQTWEVRLFPYRQYSGIIPAWDGRITVTYYPFGSLNGVEQ